MQHTLLWLGATSGRTSTPACPAKADWIASTSCSKGVDNIWLCRTPIIGSLMVVWLSIKHFEIIVVCDQNTETRAASPPLPAQQKRSESPPLPAQKVGFCTFWLAVHHTIYKAESSCMNLLPEIRNAVCVTTSACSAKKGWIASASLSTGATCRLRTKEQHPGGIVNKTRYCYVILDGQKTKTLTTQQQRSGSPPLPAQKVHNIDWVYHLNAKLVYAPSLYWKHISSTIGAK